MNTGISTERIGALAVANAKGGVGKTAVAANVAACWASSGPDPVVVVDLDPQANLTEDLSVAGDGGRSLIDAIDSGGGVVPASSGRDGLSVIAAGEHTAALARFEPADLARRLAAALAPLAARARLVVDTPPSAASPIADAALQVARWLVIPTRCDPRSITGIPTMLARILAHSDHGDLIRPVGVALFATSPRATVINAQTRADLTEALAGAFPVLEASIRAGEKASRDAREAGLAARELAILASQKPPGVAFATNTAAVADDYEALAAEIEALIDWRRP